MPKIALIDIDQTLVNNKTSELNLELIKRIRAGGYDQVWLFTGRLVTEVHQHVMNWGKPPANWQNQLTINLVKRLQEFGITVAGVSTPADHCSLSNVKVGNYEDLTPPYAPGEGWRKTGLEAYEKALLETTSSSEQSFRNDNCFMGIASSHSRIASEINEKLAMRNDTEKAGQSSHLLSHILQGYRNETVHVDFFDDKVENLCAVAKAAEIEQWHDRNANKVTLNCFAVTLPSSTSAYNFIASVAASTEVVLPSSSIELKTQATFRAERRAEIQKIEERIDLIEELQMQRMAIAMRSKFVNESLDNLETGAVPTSGLDLLLYKVSTARDIDSYKVKQALLEQKKEVLKACYKLLFSDMSEKDYQEFNEILKANKNYGDSKYSCIWANHSGTHRIVEKTIARYKAMQKAQQSQTLGMPSGSRPDL